MAQTGRTHCPEGTMVATAPALPLPAAGGMSVEARGFALASSAANTRRAYRAAWADFVAWCGEEGVHALPASPEAVGNFLAARAATLRASTLSLRLVAIGQAHRLAGLRLDTGHPAIRETLRGIRRQLGTAPTKRNAATTTVVRDIADSLARQDGLRALRDRALLLVGFAAALRRSELVALDVEDLRFVPDGVVLTLRRSKTDQDGAGTEIAIPHGSGDRTCPVATLLRWLAAAGIEAGPVFVSVRRSGRASGTRLSGRDVARVVKARVAEVGLNPKDFGGHSLRAGFITSAAEAGVAERHIQNQSRHKSLPVLRGYIRRGSLFRDNAAARVGL